MTQMLRFDGTNDHVTIPSTPSITGDWDCEFKIIPKANTTYTIFGGGSVGRIQLRVDVAQVRVNGAAGISYDIACPVDVNETVKIWIRNRVSPARLTVFKEVSGAWVQTGEVNFQQALNPFIYIGRISTFGYASTDFYYARLWNATNDFLYTAAGVTSGTVLPEVNTGANGTLVNFTGTPWVNDELFTLPTTITPLSNFTSTAIAPYVDGDAVINFGGVSVAVTISGGEFTTQMPIYVDGQFYPKIPLNGAITLTQGASTSTIYRPIALPTGYQTLRTGDVAEGAAPVNFLDIIDDDDEYIAWWFAQAGNPLTTARTSYWPNASGLFLNRNSSYELPEENAPLTVDIGIRNDSDGIVTTHTLNITATGVEPPVGGAEITSVGAIRIGDTTPVTVANFTGAVNAGTLDGVALTSASDTSITLASLVDGANVPRPGTRELELTDGSETAAVDVVVNPPLGWSSYAITGDFVEAINGVGADYLPGSWAVTDFILSPNAPSSGKTTTVTDSGVVTNNVGTQELFFVDAATGLATAFDIVTTAGAGEIGTGSATEPTMQVIKMESLKMVGL